MEIHLTDIPYIEVFHAYTNFCLCGDVSCTGLVT